MAILPNWIHPRNVEHFSREGFDGRILVDKRSKAGFSLLLINCYGEHPQKRMIDTTRCYFVVAGSGWFKVDDNTYDVQPDQLVTINPGQTYSYLGEMTLLEVNISPDNSFQDELVNQPPVRHYTDAYDLGHGTPGP